MARLNEKIFNQRLSRLGARKSSIGTTPKTICAGLFLALGILAGISTWQSISGTLAQFLIGIPAIAFTLVSILTMLERNAATTIGYSSIVYFIFVITTNYILTGSAGVGFIWLFTLLFAIKTLFEFDQFLARKRSAKDL